MAKKKTNKFDDDVVSNQLISKYGNIIESGEEVLEKLEKFNIISVSPALDIALGGGIREGNCVIIGGDPKSGKEQPLTSMVYTPSGPVRMGDIKVGDTVCTPDGGSARVDGVFPQGVKSVYRITFNDNSFAECGIDHLWKVSKNYYGRTNEWRVLSLKEILKEGLFFYSNRPKWKIPLCNPVNFNKRDLPIDPYILGCLLGDGGFAQGTPVITTADEDILESFKVFAENNKLRINHKSKHDYTIVGLDDKTNSLTDNLRLLGLMGKNSHNKFIPAQYIYSSILDRFELINGLMDIDGYNDNGKNAEYSTVSYALCMNVMEVLQSLGYTAKIKERLTKCEGKEFKYFRLHISGNNIDWLFKLPRKRFNKLRSKPGLYKTIRRVDLVREEQCQCISIDHENHLYLTDNFTVTHNTTTALYFAAKCQALGKNIIYFNTEGRMTKENFTGIKGLDPKKIKVVQATDEAPVVSAEMYLNALEAYIKGTPDLVVIVDSVSNMVPQEELEGEVRTGVRNNLPRLLSMFFKRISGDVSRNKAIVICILHNIANTGGSRWSPAKMEDSGNMIQYQAGTKMIITHKGKWTKTGEDSGPSIGQIANWKILTSASGGIPNSTAQGWIRYGIGIDEAQEIAQIANEFNMIKRSGAWYEIIVAIENRNDPVIKKLLETNSVDIKDEEAVNKFFRFQGMQNLTDFLVENEEITAFIYNQIKETK